MKFIDTHNVSNAECSLATIKLILYAQWSGLKWNMMNIRIDKHVWRQAASSAMQARSVALWMCFIYVILTDNLYGQMFKMLATFLWSLTDCLLQLMTSALFLFVRKCRAMYSRHLWTAVMLIIAVVNYQQIIQSADSCELHVNSAIIGKSMSDVNANDTALKPSSSQCWGPWRHLLGNLPADIDSAITDHYLKHTSVSKKFPPLNPL